MLVEKEQAWAFCERPPANARAGRWPPDKLVWEAPGKVASGHSAESLVTGRHGAASSSAPPMGKPKARCCRDIHVRNSA